MAETTDFEAEGLLDGLEGEAREARQDLLKNLANDGVGLDELRLAVEEDRLALLPLERALASEYRYTPEEVAEKAGIQLELLLLNLRSLGLPVPQPGERLLTEEDLEAALRAKTFTDAGLPAEGIMEVTRVIGMSMAQLAEATRSLIGEVYLQAGDTERDLGLRYVEMAKLMTPVLGDTMQYVYARHLRESIKQAAVSEADRASGELVGSTDVTVAFADLVGFTRLGERLEVSEIGEISGRLAEIATSIVESPVRLIKMIGDAAMIVAPEPGPVVETALRLVEAVETDEQLPPLRAGAARGEALARAGDWYGRPVNLASRITNFAIGDSVVVNEAVKDALEEDEGPYRFSYAGKRRFKGIQGEVAVYRVRRREPGGRSASVPGA
ncbi:MAG: adenylate cyclase regulatory domain-containing protein [Solirubrobacterales bacterium]